MHNVSAFYTYTTHPHLSTSYRMVQ